MAAYRAAGTGGRPNSPVSRPTSPARSPASPTAAIGASSSNASRSAASSDSRSHLGDHNGTIPASDVIGRAFVVVWPPSDWKTLPVPGTFHQKGLAAAALEMTSDPLVAGFVGAVPLTLLRRRAAYRRRVRRWRRQSAGS